MKKLLITGFDPFGGSGINPAQMAVEQLPNEIGDFSVEKMIIPTVFGEAARQVCSRIDQWQPDVVLCIGVAVGRDGVTPERIGVNIRDARIPDNAGNQPKGQFVAEDGPAAYFATVPVEAMAAAMEAQGIPARVSNSAGAFVCNDVMYSVLHHCSGTATKVGFIHVPAIPSADTPADQPTLPLSQITAALTTAILTLA